MLKCIFCDNELTEDTQPEHILLNALGGRKTTRRVDCSGCNGRFERTIDDEVRKQAAVLRTAAASGSGFGAHRHAIVAHFVGHKAIWDFFSSIRAKRSLVVWD
jgi:hypothetical protein